MAITWGATTLNIRYGTYNPPAKSNMLSEIDILPDGTSAPSTVYQQKGVGRDKVRMTGQGSLSDYYTLQADYLALTERAFSDGTYSFTTSIIEELSEPRLIACDTYSWSLTISEV